MKIKPSCYICQSSQDLTEQRVSNYTLWRCRACSLDFIWPVPSPEDIKEFYDRSEWFEGGEKGGYEDYVNQTKPSLNMFEDMLSRQGPGNGRSMLDIGCGYGLHMAMAKDKGWNCFGIEPSEHARRVAKKHFYNSLFIVDSVENMIPHEFDLIILFDVIEHIGDPCLDLFYKLFSIGAITPDTEIIVTTPNARSNSALDSGNDWQYLHPPSHLTYYSGIAIRKLFEKLMFKNIKISGLHPGDDQMADAPLPHGENDSDNINLRLYNGLLCKASGSTFKSFIQERYLPGTWNRLAKYEHLPRYLLALNLISNQVVQSKKTLDFGCGTGYGTQIIATGSDRVTGLDIDKQAVSWARTYNATDNIDFVRSDNLGADLPPRTFDLITCFEMIEHIDSETQKELLDSLKRLLKTTGVALLSTPEPKITAKYGANEFHIHELCREEFSQLLKKNFEHVQILEQRIAPAVLIASQEHPQRVNFTAADFKDKSAGTCPVAYIAVCSSFPLNLNLNLCYMDYESDLVLEELFQQKRYYEVLNQLYDIKNLNWQNSVHSVNK